MISRIKEIVASMLRIHRYRCKKAFLADENHFWRTWHGKGDAARSHQEAWIGIEYHIIEKGLTMPKRHLSFGKGVIRQLIIDITQFINNWGESTFVVDHAIGVVKQYLLLHEHSGCDFSDDLAYWNAVREFIGRYPYVRPASQMHFTIDDFYVARTSSFPEFARSRHTVRSYSGLEIPKEKLVNAVELAMTAPSACNRQHVRVHCIANQELGHKLLDLQGGNRGFGHLANKVLIVTSDLTVEMSDRERHDPYVNGGIFLMNLCYSLHYYGVAHCVLSCGIDKYRIEAIRSLANIPDREVMIGMLSCGIAPEEFDVAASPRRSVDDILIYKE